VRDVLFPLLVVAFFALAALLVRACERLLAAGDSGRAEEIDLP